MKRSNSENQLPTFSQSYQRQRFLNKLQKRNEKMIDFVNKVLNFNDPQVTESRVSESHSFIENSAEINNVDKPGIIFDNKNALQNYASDSKSEENNGDIMQEQAKNEEIVIDSPDEDEQCQCQHSCCANLKKQIKKLTDKLERIESLFENEMKKIRR